MEENTPLESEELAKVESLHEASRPSGLDLAARVYRGLISFRDDEGERPLIEDAYRLVRKESTFAKLDLGDESRLSYFDKLQGMLESGNEFPEDSSAFFELEPDEYEKLKDEFDAYARDTTATYSAIEAIIEDMRNPLNSGQMVFKRIFGHFSQVNEKLGAQLSYNYFFNGNPFDEDLITEDRYNIRSSVKNYFKRELLRSTRRYSSIERRLNQDFEFASQLQQNTDTYVNRPGILPLMDLIRNSSSAIDIDIFQLQNESVMDMLVAKKIENPQLQIRIKLASLDEGRIDRVSTDILAPNAFVSGVFEALNIYGQDNIENYTQIEIYRARSRNHPKLIVGDKEAIIGSMNVTYPLGNNPLKAGANFEIIRRVRDETKSLGDTVRQKIDQGEELKEGEYSRLSEGEKQNYLNTYLYRQLKEVMNYNIEQFKRGRREEDVPFYYQGFAARAESFGTGTGLVGGPSDMYTLLDISLGKLREGRGQSKYGLLMNIDQPLILQGVLGEAVEVGYRVGEFGLFDAQERSLLGRVMENFEQKSLQLLESIGRGEAFVVVDPRNYRAKVLNPFRAALDPLIGSDLAQYGGRLEQLVAAKASGTGYDERLANLTNYMKERVSQDQSGLAEGLAKQMLAITSSNIQMATHPKAHAKGFSLFEITKNGIQYLINSMGSGNYTPGSLLPPLDYLKNTLGIDIDEEQYQELAKTSSNELSLQGYDPQVVEDRYDVGGSGFLAKELAKEQGKHLEHSFDELTYSGKFADIQRSIEEGGPSKFQGTDARWEKGVDLGRTAALQERIQTMFNESGLGERGATAELIRDNQSNASRILVTLNYNQMTDSSGLANKRYELSVMQGGQVYLVNKGLIVSSAVFTNQSGMTIENFLGQEDLATGETRNLSSEDVALSIFGTLALEAVQLGTIELPKAFSEQDTSDSAFYYYLADVLGLKGKEGFGSTQFTQDLIKRFGGSNQVKTLAKLSEDLFTSYFTEQVDTTEYQKNLTHILTDDTLKPKEKLALTLGMLVDIDSKYRAESRIMHRVYSRYGAASFSFELNERLQALESDLLKPFLTYTQSHTYSASTETTRKIRLGVSANSMQREAIQQINEGGPINRLGRYAAMALPYAGVIEDISQALITSVAGGMAEIGDRPLSTFFKTRAQSYEEVKSLDLIEILSVGARLNNQVIQEYLEKREFSEEEAAEIEEQFMAKLDAGEFITTFGGQSKFSQIGQRLKNVGGSRALLEMSYSAQYLIEQSDLDTAELESKLSQDVFGFLFEKGAIKTIEKDYYREELMGKPEDLIKHLKAYENILGEVVDEVVDSSTLSTIDQQQAPKLDTAKKNMGKVLSIIGRLEQARLKLGGIFKTEKNKSIVDFTRILEHKSALNIPKLLLTSDSTLDKLDQLSQELISNIESIVEIRQKFSSLSYNPQKVDLSKGVLSLQQAYVENLRKALTLYGIDTNLAKSLVPDEYGVAAIAGGRIRSVMPSDAYQILIEERQRLADLTGKPLEFFDQPVGQELLRASVAYRDTETMGARGFLGSRKEKTGYSLLQLGGFYYDANFFYNPEYDGGVRYFFTDRVKKTVMAGQLSLSNLKVEVEEGDIIRPVSEGSETYGIYRPGKGKIGEVTDRSQVNAISNVLDTLSAQEVASLSTVTRKASVPPGRDAIELVIGKVERSSTSKAAFELELSLARSTRRTGGAREDIAQGLFKAVGIGDKNWFAYAQEELGGDFRSSDIFGVINESSMKSYIYGHGLTIAQTKELKEEFLQKVRENPDQAAAALLYMFGNEPFGEAASSLKDTYTQKALAGEYGTFFKKETAARLLQGKSVTQDSYNPLQTPSLGISAGSTGQDLQEALSGTSNSLITFIEQLVESAARTPSTTTGAGAEGLMGREADMIITAIDFYQQLVEIGDKSLLPPALDLSQDKSLRTLALGMGYSAVEIEDILKNLERKEELIQTILSQSSSVALRFYQVPTPGQMKTPLSSQATSKAEIQTRLSPFVTTGDAFSPSNEGVRNIRRMLTAGLLALPSKQMPASAAFRATRSVRLTSLNEDNDLLQKLISLQEAHRTLATYSGPGLNAAQDRLKRLGKFEEDFYKAHVQHKGYNLGQLEKELTTADLEETDKEFIKKAIEEVRNSFSDKLKKKPEAAVRSILFQAASNISAELRGQSLLFSQDSTQQFNVSSAQDFIKNLKSSGMQTFGMQLPELITLNQSDTAKTRARFVLGEENLVTGVILGGEYLQALQTAQLQDFVSEVLTTQYKLQEMLSEGHALKTVLRKLLKKSKGNTASIELTLTDEEVRAYTQFVNLLSRTAGQMTESLSESYLKQIMGAQDSPGYVATGVGLLGLGVQETVMPKASRERAFEASPARKAALEETIEQLINLDANTPGIEERIEFLEAKAAAIFEGISPEAQRFFNLYKTQQDKAEQSDLLGVDSLEEKIKTLEGRGDKYIYLLIQQMKEEKRGGSNVFYSDYQLAEDVRVENRYVRVNPKKDLMGLNEKDLDLYISELSREEYASISEVDSLKKLLENYRKELSEADQAPGSEYSIKRALAKLKFQQAVIESGFEAYVRSLRSAPTGSMIISQSTFNAISLEELNERYKQTSKLFDKYENYQSQIDPTSSNTLNILPLLSVVTTMLGDFDGDQIISSFVTYSDKILKQVKLNIEIERLSGEILNPDPDNNLSEEERNKQIERLKKNLSKEKDKLALVKQQINALQNDFDPEKVNRAVISHVSRYLGIDESYFLEGVDNYYYQLLSEEKKAEYREDRSSFPAIREKPASIEEMTLLIEQGRGLMGSLQGTKDAISELEQRIKTEDFKEDPLLNNFIQEQRDQGKEDRQIAEELVSTLQATKTFTKMGGLAKGLIQNESSLMLSLLAMGQAGSVVLGKTYNVLYGSLLADAPIIALKRSLDNNQADYLRALENDLNLETPKAEKKYQELKEKVDVAFEKTQALKAFTMSIEQMMRDSIKPKKNDQFMKDLESSVQKYQEANSDEERNDIIRELTKSLGSGPKGLLSLINLHDFLGSNQQNFSLEQNQKLLAGLLSKNPAQDLQIITQYLGITSTDNIQELSQGNLNKVIHYLLSRDVLNTSAGFMYERTYDLKGFFSYLGDAFEALVGIKSRFKDNIKQTLKNSKFIGEEVSDLNVQDIKDLGLKQFLEHYNADGKNLFNDDGKVTTQGFQAIEFWLKRYNDSKPLLGENGESLQKLKTLKQIRDTIAKEGEVSPTDIDTLDLVIKQLTLETATRGKGDVGSLFKTLANLQGQLQAEPEAGPIDRISDFLTKQDNSNLYNSEEASAASKHLVALLTDIQDHLDAEGSVEGKESDVLRMLNAAFGLTYTGEVKLTLEGIQKEMRESSKLPSREYLSAYDFGMDSFDLLSKVSRDIEKWLGDTSLSFLDRQDSDLAAQTLSRFRESSFEMTLESLLIPAIILGHAIASGYDPESTTSEVIGQQVVGGTLISTLYSTNVFSKIEQNKAKDIFKRGASSTLIGSAAKVRLTMAQDDEDDLVSGVIRTLSMEAAFTAASALTSQVIETELSRKRKISSTLNIDALESAKTAASFVTTALISAAMGLLSQNAVKQVIRPSALETLQSVVANINQYVSHQRTQTARYETETVDMETEVDIPVYELTAITDYVQADMVSEHILSLSSTEMSGELIEEPIFVRSAEGEEV